MNNNNKKSKIGTSKKVRTAFPPVCKWFAAETDELNTKESASEVGKRYHRFQESGTSPCDGCPLCQHHQ